MAASRPNVQHDFTPKQNGRLLAHTLEQRTEVRRALTVLQQAFANIEGCPTQMTAEIRFTSSKSPPQDEANVYSVIITDVGFEVGTTARPDGSVIIPASQPVANSSSSAAAGDAPQNDIVQPQTNGQDTDEIRPSKRRRLSADGDVPTNDNEPSVQSDSSTDKTLGFVREWNREWMMQGGWLFDTLNRAEALTREGMVTWEKKLLATQDVLGLSINAANATMTTEFGEVKKLFQWLNDCRKEHDDFGRARDEKWRASSAAFHHQARCDREAAEKRLQTTLAMHTQLLVRIAGAVGYEVNGLGGGDEDSHGAQLTARLVRVAKRGGSEDGADALSINSDGHHDDDDND